MLDLSDIVGILAENDFEKINPPRASRTRVYLERIFPFEETVVYQSRDFDKSARIFSDFQKARNGSVDKQSIILKLQMSVQLNETIAIQIDRG